MISKSTLTSIISKYYLDGLNQQVKWRIKDNTLTVYAGELGQVCMVSLKGFDFEDGELGIFDTHKLNKLISITSGTLMLTPVKSHKIFTKLQISDQNFDLTYALADILILGKTQYYNDPEEGYDMTLPLSSVDIDNLIKAKSALQDVNTMMLTTKRDLDSEPICEILFGDGTGYANKITYQLKGEILDHNIEMPFNSDIFRSILKANKDMDTATLKVSGAGMMKLNFENSEMESEYFVCRNE